MRFVCVTSKSANQDFTLVSLFSLLIKKDQKRLIVFVMQKYPKNIV